MMPSANPLHQTNADLERAVFDLIHHYDCGLLRLPQVCRNLRQKGLSASKSDTFANDPTIDRLCAEIREIGEQLFTLDGVDALREAIRGFDARASRIAEMLWHGIGGVWFA